MHDEMLAHDHTSTAKNGRFWQGREFTLEYPRCDFQRYMALNFNAMWRISS
jgi:hypothetical protein